MTLALTRIEGNRDELQAEADDRPRLVFVYSDSSGLSRRADGFLAQVLQRRRNHETFAVHAYRSTTGRNSWRTSAWTTFRRSSSSRGGESCAGSFSRRDRKRSRQHYRPGFIDEGSNVHTTLEEELRRGTRPVIEPPPPRPDPRPEPPPEPVPDPLPEPPDPEPEPSAIGLLPVRIEAPTAASAALLVQRAVGRFRPELVEEDERWAVLLHPDRPQQQLVLDAIELARNWLKAAELASANVLLENRQYQVHR
jgi:hypothetical protein